MAAPGIAPISVVLEGFSGSDRIATPALLDAMLRAEEKISDLIFSPGRPPQVEKQGQLASVAVSEVPILRPEDTARVARDLVGSNEQALRTLKEQGACDLSYSIPERCRFRVNVFRQRGTFAIVMRVIAQKIPTIAENVIPGRCEMTLDRRMIPGEVEAEVIAEIESVLAGVV